MPIYEYQCLSCERVSEFFLRVSDPHPDTCPKCGRQTELKKQISQTSFSLRGEGWYVTDYKPQVKKEVGDLAKTETKSEDSAQEAGKSSDAGSKTASENSSQGVQNSPDSGAKASSSATPASADLKTK